MVRPPALSPPEPVQPDARGVGSGSGGTALQEPCQACGVSMAEDQEWCLECGVARTVIERPPDWRVGLIIVLAVVALAAITAAAVWA